MSNTCAPYGIRSIPKLSSLPANWVVTTGLSTLPYYYASNMYLGGGSIIADSMSLVSRLKVGCIKETWKDLLRSIRAELIVTYIPGYCDITQNERTEKHTSEAHSIWQK